MDKHQKSYRCVLGVVTALIVGAAINFAYAQDTRFRACSSCPEMVRIPSGNFLMGISAVEEQRENVPELIRSLKQQHRVSVPSFSLGTYDVTRAEFERFVRETGYRARNQCYAVVHTGGQYYKEGEGHYELKVGTNWQNPAFPQTDHDPVVCVSWDDAQAYITWLSRKTGYAFRLPTEAEWEYAARAGTTSARFWGDDRLQACKYANVYDLTATSELQPQADNLQHFNCRDGFVFTAPVGSFKPNEFGLYDILGNVWQWVADCSIHPTYLGAPTDGSALTKQNCQSHVTRGGSWA